MYTIALCDDDAKFMSLLKDELIKTFSNKEYEIKIDCYSSGREILAALEYKKYKAIFLDIHMKGMNGFDVAQEIAMRKIESNLIFVTTDNELVYESFDYRPFHFIRKSHYQDTLIRVTDKLIYAARQDKEIEIQTREGIVSIPYKDIVYINSEDHYVYIHTRRNEYYTRRKLTEFEQELIGYDFVRCHRSYIVNLKYVKKIDLAFDQLILINGIKLEMSRLYKNAVKEKYKMFHRIL